MIPKTIHYCWFGGNPLPDFAIKCISSWKQFFPGYEIKQWNEDNFDVNIIQYTAEAYKEKKYAFVSDYARFWILYNYGGLYFDTDVEVVKPMDDIIARGSFMGIEMEAEAGKFPLVNPGLGLGATKNHMFYKEMLNYYNYQHFINADGSLNLVTVVTHVTKMLISQGLGQINTLQKVAGIWIYPCDYFNPLNDLTGKLNKTNNTRSIHWYTRTWSDSSTWRIALSRWSHRIFGMGIHKIKKILKG